MKKEIKDLFKLRGKKFDERLDALHKQYKDNEQFKKEVELFIAGRLSRTAKNIEMIEKEINIKKQIEEVSEIISLSYIARVYFGKTRSWLHQRINGNIVNGKSAQFTATEMKQFQHALKDISKKLGSLSITG